MADNDTYELFEEVPPQPEAPGQKAEPYSVSASVTAPFAGTAAENAASAQEGSAPEAGKNEGDLVFSEVPGAQEAKSAPVSSASPAAKAESDSFKSGAFRAKEIPKDAIRIHDIPGDIDLATYLRTLRTENGLSLDDLAQCTGISKNYLAALESDSDADLPPIAYALAYVRRLGSLYQVPPDRMPRLSEALRDRLEPELPEDMSKSIVDHAESEENVRRIRQLALVLGTAGILVVIALILGGLLLWAGLRRHNANQNQPFQRSILVEMQGEPKLQVPYPAVPSR